MMITIIISTSITLLSIIVSIMGAAMIMIMIGSCRKCAIIDRPYDGVATCPE